MSPARRAADPLEVMTVRRLCPMPLRLRCGRRVYRRASPARGYPSGTYYTANGRTFYTIYDLRAMIRAGRKKK